MTTFRVFYSDGTTFDVDADSPDAAREKARGKRKGKITKVKVVKDKGRGYSETPVRHLPMDQELVVRRAVASRLRDAVHAGANALGLTPAAYVMIAMNNWASELVSVDAEAGVKFLRSLAIGLDPKASEEEVERAEREHSDAMAQIYASVDLLNAEARGHG